MMLQIRGKNFCNEAGLVTSAAVVSVLVICGLALTAYYVFGQVVPPGYMGIRQTTTGPTQGFSEEGLAPGLRLAVPFITRIHLIPRTIQVLSFRRIAPGEEGSPELGDESHSGLEIRTTDGSPVNLDVSILTRFYAEATSSNGGPRELLTRVGITDDDWDNQIRRVAADELREALGALLARQFYEEPMSRQSALDKAKVEMQKRLAPFGIEVVSVLLRRYTYSDDRIDEAIFNKNLQEQEERLKDASSRLAEVKAQLERVAAEWDAKVKTLEVQGQSRAEVLKSEAELFSNEKKAEGDLVVAQAKAEIDRLRAQVLSQSTGADIHVARQLAPLLGSLRGGLVSNIDPYDLDSWATRLGVDSKAVRSQPRPAGTRVPARAAPEIVTEPATQAAAGGAQ